MLAPFFLLIPKAVYILWYNGKLPDATIKMKTLTSCDIYVYKNSAKCVATGDAVKRSPAGKTQLCSQRPKAPFIQTGVVKVSHC